MTMARLQERLELHKSCDTVSVFYFCTVITMNLASQHNNQSLAHGFINENFSTTVTGFSALGIERLKTSSTEFLSRDSVGVGWEVSASNRILGVGGLRSLSPCWLAVSQSPLSATSGCPHSSPRGPLHASKGTRCKSTSRFRSLTSSVSDF